LTVNQLSGQGEPLGLRAAALAVIVVVVGCVTMSVWAGVGALAALGARFREMELPRGIYGWSITIQASPNYAAFCEFLAQQDPVEGARAELYLVVKQHAHRYGRLRLAMRALLGALGGFVVLVSIGAVASLL
jgi:hypothetical protein